MRRKLVVFLVLTLVVVITAAWAAPGPVGITSGAAVVAGWLHRASAAFIQISRGITEPVKLVIVGVFVILFSWLVRRKISRMHH